MPHPLSSIPSAIPSAIATACADTAPLADDLPKRGGRAQEIRAVLQDEIESGKLAPGATLDERVFAQRFGVSRTPIREALQQLAARDLVRIAPRQGVSVARLSINQIRGIMESVGELEGLVAKLAARRVDNDLRNNLSQALAIGQHAAKKADPAEYAVANTAFHEAIYAGSRNPYLSELIRTARRTIQRYRIRDFHNKTQISNSFKEHVQIAQAIQDGDEEHATQAMLLHTPSGSTGFSEFLARVPLHLFETELTEA
jgi:DNA-binding GntR family transcriptional regulator